MLKRKMKDIRSNLAGLLGWVLVVVVICLVFNCLNFHSRSILKIFRHPFSTVTTYPPSLYCYFLNQKCCLSNRTYRLSTLMFEIVRDRNKIDFSFIIGKMVDDKFLSYTDVKNSNFTLFKNSTSLHHWKSDSNCKHESNKEKQAPFSLVTLGTGCCLRTAFKQHSSGL